MKFTVRGTGPAVLLLHGLPTSGRLWDFVVPQLEPRFTCVVVDLPGAGESPAFADGSLAGERFAEELEQLRAQLGIPAWHVVGHDAGAAIAVHYAACYGAHLDRFVLCAPPIFPEHKIPWFFRLLRTPALGDALAPLVTNSLLPFGIKYSIRRDDPAMDDIVRAFCQPFRGYAGARRFLHLLRWGDPQPVLSKTAALLPSITAPALILSGLHDGAVPVRFAQRAAQLLPNAEVYLLDCGHFIPLECPDILCSYLLHFLSTDFDR
jgi:pimeloyl-ACP methyl ester carboxylesterase